MSKKTAVDFFTPEEHQIFSDYFGVDPLVDIELPSLDDALERLGFEKDAGRPYTNVDAAVAFIVLEAVEKRLPQWASVADGDVYFAREYRPENLVPARRAAVLPQYLFTLNWADSGPGFSWPCAYYTTWVPLYERFVVTESADCPDAFEYADIAVGQFGAEESLSDGSRRVIVEDWRYRYNEWSQGRWVYLFGTGLVGEGEADAWADEVWGEDWDESNV